MIADFGGAKPTQISWQNFPTCRLDDMADAEENRGNLHAYSSDRFDAPGRDLFDSA